jgi:hypothetical protein
MFTLRAGAGQLWSKTCACVCVCVCVCLHAHRAEGCCVSVRLQEAQVTLGRSVFSPSLGFSMSLSSSGIADGQAWASLHPSPWAGDFGTTWLRAHLPEILPWSCAWQGRCGWAVKSRQRATLTLSLLSSARLASPSSLTSHGQSGAAGVSTERICRVNSGHLPHTHPPIHSSTRSSIIHPFHILPSIPIEPYPSIHPSIHSCSLSDVCSMRSSVTS